jgi:hypothetical protein
MKGGESRRKDEGKEEAAEIEKGRLKLGSRKKGGKEGRKEED